MKCCRSSHASAQPAVRAGEKPRHSRFLWFPALPPPRQGRLQCPHRPDPRGRGRVTRALLDVNVLLALLHSDHIEHERAKAWLDSETPLASGGPGPPPARCCGALRSPHAARSRHFPGQKPSPAAPRPRPRPGGKDIEEGRGVASGTHMEPLLRITENVGSRSLKM